MSLIQSSKNSPHENTYKILKEKIKMVRKKARQERMKELQNAQISWWGKLRYKLFKLNWLINALFTVLIGLILIVITTFIAHSLSKITLWWFLESSNILMIYLSISIIIIYVFLVVLCIPFLLTQMTPTLNANWDEFWLLVTNLFIKELTTDNENKYKEQQGIRALLASIISKDTKLAYNENAIKKVKKKLSKAILFYERKAQPFKFLMNLLWGGVFIGCLPDEKFHMAIWNAFQADSIIQAWKLIYEGNKFGAISLVLVAIIVLFSFLKYDIPITRMEIVLNQIELDE